MAQAVDTFTVSDVNSRLPLLRLIVRDVLETQQQIAEIQPQLDAFLDEDGGEPDDDREFEALQARMRKQEDRLNELLDEVDQTGGLFADLKSGHVEFASTLGDDPIWLSWKYDEPTVAFWRGWHDRPQDRHPLELVESP